MRVALDVTPLFRATRPFAGVPQVVKGLLHGYRGLGGVTLQPFVDVARAERSTPSGTAGKELDGLPLYRYDGAASLPPTDVVHFTYTYPENTAPHGAAHILLVHDCRPVIYPVFYPHDGAWQIEALSRLMGAGGIAHVLSPTVMVELEALGIASSNICVTVPPVVVPAREGPPNGPKPGQFILLCGSVANAKNVPGVLAAWSLALRRHTIRPGVMLVIVGEASDDAANVRRLLRMLPRDRVRWLHGLPDTARITLLCHALALVQLSWHEGVGIPALEAAKIGVPVIASDTASHRAALRGTACFVTLGDIDALASLLASTANGGVAHDVLRTREDKLERMRGSQLCGDGVVRRQLSMVAESAISSRRHCDDDASRVIYGTVAES